MTEVLEKKPRVLPQVGVPAADGTVLATDVYLPEAATARPTVLIRTPYGRTAPLLMRLALQLSKTGFAAVLQDCRGRYGSGGSFDLLSEAGDSRGTLEWLVEQPWCDGRVGLVGISISGLPNLMVAAEPAVAPHVRALVNVMGAVDYHRMCYRGGALVLHWALPWITMMGAGNMGRTSWQSLDWERVFRHRPLESAVAETGGNEDFWRLVISYPGYGGFWEKLSAVPRLGEIRAPVLHLGGRRDFMLDQTLLAFSTLAEAGHAGLQKLIIGPWDHQTVFAPAGPGSQGTGVTVLDQLVDWFVRWLGDDGPAAAASGTEVTVHVENLGWLDTGTLPPEAAVEEAWFLSSRGSARTAGGDGLLSPEKPSSLGLDTYDYDPSRPVPTAGGAIWPFPAAGLHPGAADQSEVESRDDVLVFTSEPLAEDRVVVGAVSLTLWAATSGRDTDFTGKLVDVAPDGTPRVVQDGILRGRFRAGREEESLLEPQTPYGFEIPLGTVAHRFRAGHRLRLEVSSSNFPKFDVNLNTAEPAHLATRAMVAQQTVFHGGEMPSRLRLPVVPRTFRDAAAEAGSRPRGESDG